MLNNVFPLKNIYIDFFLPVKKAIRYIAVTNKAARHIHPIRIAPIPILKVKNAWVMAANTASPIPDFFFKNVKSFSYTFSTGSSNRKMNPNLEPNCSLSFINK